MDPPARARRSRRAALAFRQQVVERAEAYLRAHVDAPVPLSTVCRVLGFSERSLRNAFYTVHGMGPKRWTITERLGRVHRLLTERQSGRTTVTRVAVEHGFHELGRFAATYRRAFGETPSATLRSCARNRRAETGGDVHAGTRP